ncbi:MAG: CRISPR-associated ring nuclease Crn3/Csx3 [Pseudanabaenaceae cyanobacterium]
MVNLRLDVSRRWRRDGQPYQHLEIRLTGPDRLIEPQDLREMVLPPLDLGLGVVLSGRAPIWLYAHLIHELHPTPWLGCYDPRLMGAVVVATHSREAKIGEIIPDDNLGNPSLCPAVLVVGPPDSGKSVLSHALFQTLRRYDEAIFLQRAHWDGEGNWVLELPDPTLAEAMKARYKGALTPEFFANQAQAILALRRQNRLVLVDVGGMVQEEKTPVLAACSHYLLISRDRQEVDKWHRFCGDRAHLLPLAVIHSTRTSVQTVQQTEPWLELTWGPWQMGIVPPLPPLLLDRLRSLMGLV